MNSILEFLLLVLKLLAWGLFCGWMYHLTGRLKTLDDRVESQEKITRHQNKRLQELSALAPTEITTANAQTVLFGGQQAKTMSTRAGQGTSGPSDPGLATIDQKLTELPFGASSNDIRQAIPEAIVTPCDTELARAVTPEAAVYVCVKIPGSDHVTYLLPTGPFSQRLMTQSTRDSALGVYKIYFDIMDSFEDVARCQPAIYNVRTNASSPWTKGRLILPIGKGPMQTHNNDVVKGQFSQYNQDLSGSTLQRDVSELWDSPRSGDSLGALERFERKWRPQKGDPEAGTPGKFIPYGSGIRHDESLNPYALWAVSDDQGNLYVIPACSPEQLRSAQVLARKLKELGSSNVWAGWFDLVEEGTTLQVINPAKAARTPGSDVQLVCINRGSLRV